MELSCAAVFSVADRTRRLMRTHWVPVPFMWVATSRMCSPDSLYLPFLHPSSSSNLEVLMALRPKSPKASATFSMRLIMCSASADASASTACRFFTFCFSSTSSSLKSSSLGAALTSLLTLFLNFCLNSLNPRTRLVPSLLLWASSVEGIDRSLPISCLGRLVRPAFQPAFSISFHSPHWEMSPSHSRKSCSSRDRDSTGWRDSFCRYFCSATLLTSMNSVL
mmetsp:Transcript_4254/g.10750  ORF Transcript_4254/g.10750 Transcript_4254/m.10750 type:complete len:222 (+) Transcript_4254:515-1180(+)